MLASLLKRPFFNLKSFNSYFTATNEKWTVEAFILPPTISEGESNVKVKYASSLMFNLFLTQQQFKKGRKADSMKLRINDMLQFACWQDDCPRFEYINNSEALIIDRVPQNKNQISLIFFNRELQEERKRKVFVTSKANLAVLQEVIKGGMESYSHQRYYQLYTIKQSIKILQK